MKFLAIIEATIREGFARKTILGMFIVSTIGILIAFFLFHMDAVQRGLLSPAVKHIRTGNQAATTQLLGYSVLDGVWLGIYFMLLTLSILIGTFVTAGFITSLMEKGTIDLLLSKPVPRWMYVVGRYSGGVLIIFAEVTYQVVGLWLCAGLSLGAWSPAFLLSIPSITLTFAGVYALVTLFGILTRSSWFAIILGLAIFWLASIVVPLGMFLDKLLTGSTGGVLTFIGRFFHYTIPQANEIAGTMKNIMFGQTVDYMPLVLALVLSVAYVALSSFAFSKKEF